MGDRIINIYCINDFHGAVESLLWWDKKDRSITDNKGIKLFSYLKNKRVKNNNTLILSAGDMFQVQNHNKNNFEGLTPLLMKEVKFDGITIGNHEFDWKAEEEDYFYKLSKQIQSSVICSNLYYKPTEKRAKGLLGSKIINFFGLKIGLIGLVTLKCRSICTKEELGNYYIRDAKKSIMEEFNYLQSQGATFIILLAHMDIYLNKNKNNFEGELVNLLEELEGININLVLAGHSHQLINTKIKGIPVIQAGAYGESLSHIQISINEAINGFDIDRINIIDDFQAELIIDSNIKNIAKEYLEKNYFEKCLISNIPYKIKTSKDSSLAWMEYIAELMKNHGKADISMVNYLFFRKPITEEPVYNSDILEYIPFSNSISLIKIKGTFLLEIIDLYEDKGLRGAFFTGISANRIKAEKEYILATTNFLAQGGDSFTLLKKGEIIHEYKETVQEIVLNNLMRMNK